MSRFSQGRASFSFPAAIQHSRQGTNSLWFKNKANDKKPSKMDKNNGKAFDIYQINKAGFQCTKDYKEKCYFCVVSGKSIEAVCRCERIGEFPLNYLLCSCLCLTADSHRNVMEIFYNLTFNGVHLILLGCEQISHRNNYVACQVP